MKYFDNYKTVNLDMLRESGMYSEQLLKVIEDGDHIQLGRPDLISKEQSQDINFMGPIVYAFEKAHRTYIGYKYCGENLQKNLVFASDIIRKEPEIIANTIVSGDREFIEMVAPEVPEIVKHMSLELKEDSTFTAELCKLNVPEVTMYAAQECKMPDAIEENPTLAENKDFMLGIIQQDANSLEYASDELKNNYEFIKEACTNEEVIEYVTEHTEKFGEQGLTAAKDVLVEKSSDEAIAGFKKENDKIKEEIESNTAKDENELEALSKRDKQLQRHIRFFERIQNGEIDPVRAAKLIDKICVNLDERYREQIKKVLKLDEAIAEKQKVVEEKAGEQENAVITHESVERKTITVATITEIQVATEGIREDFKMEEERVSQQANIELGENI